MMDSSDPIARFDRVSKVYHGGGGDVTAVDQLTLSIPRGVTVFSGPSGCGKSTLINLLGALDEPTSGTIELGGHRLDQLDEAGIDRYRRETIGIVFQFFHLMPTLTVQENVALPAELAGTPVRQAMERAGDLLAKVQMSHRTTHRPHELSGGEIQRTAIARALINHPLVVLADEPTGNLDSLASQRVMELFTKVTAEEGASAIVATHDPDVVRLADRVLKFRDGRLEP